MDWENGRFWVSSQSVRRQWILHMMGDVRGVWFPAKTFGNSRIFSILRSHIWLINYGKSAGTQITHVFDLQPYLQHAKSSWCQLLKYHMTESMQTTQTCSQGLKAQHDVKADNVAHIVILLLRLCKWGYDRAAVRWCVILLREGCGGVWLHRTCTCTHMHAHKRRFNRSRHENVELNIVDPVLPSSAPCVGAGDWGNDE